MRVARIAGPESGIELVDADIPTPGPGEILVRSHAVGICGSDLGLLTGTRPAAFVRYPVIPGHEWSGQVVAVGHGVDTISAGTPIACMGLERCGVCARCRDGRIGLCERGYGEVGFTVPGGLAQWVVIRADQAVRLPTAIGLDEAALLEPAAVVCHAFLRCPPVAGRTVTVVGDGTLGQLAVQIAHACGAVRVTMLGLDEGRLALAAKLGADEVGRHGPTSPADVVIEAAGAPGTLRLALDRACRGGTVAVLGVTGGAPLDVPADRLVVDDLTVTGVLASTPASWSDALRLTASGRVALEPLITHRFGLDGVADAFALAAARPPGAVKILIEHRGEGSRT
jgi:2-desacetyl-2-hydroxyethyl bacteriochlorophyllide A dehydrogenase